MRHGDDRTQSSAGSPVDNPSWTARDGREWVSYAARLRPDERFSHTTALALFGCPVRVPLYAPVDVEIPVGSSQVRARGVRGHRRRRVEHPYCCAVPESLELLPTVQPLRAVLQAANELPFTDLLVAVSYTHLDVYKRQAPATGAGRRPAARRPAC